MKAEWIPCPRCEEKRADQIPRSCALCDAYAPFYGQIEKEKAVLYILLRGETRNYNNRVYLAAWINEGKSIEECRKNLEYLHEQQAGDSV